MEIQRRDSFDKERIGLAILPKKNKEDRERQNHSIF